MPDVEGTISAEAFLASRTNWAQVEIPARLRGTEATIYRETIIRGTSNQPITIVTITDGSAFFHEQTICDIDRDEAEEQGFLVSESGVYLPLHQLFLPENIGVVRGCTLQTIK